MAAAVRHMTIPYVVQHHSHNDLVGKDVMVLDDIQHGMGRATGLTREVFLRLKEPAKHFNFYVQKSRDGSETWMPKVPTIFGAKIMQQLGEAIYTVYLRSRDPIAGILSNVAEFEE